MNNLLKINPLVILFLISLTAFSKEKDYIISTGFSGSQLTILDRGPSALSYSNYIYGFGLSYIEETVNWSDEMTLHFQKGFLKSDQEFSTEPKIYSYLFDWRRSWDLKNIPNWKTQIGFHWHNGYTKTSRTEFSNNKDYFCFISSISPYINTKKILLSSQKHTLNFFTEASYSPLAYIIRPSLTSIDPVSMGGEKASTFWKYITSGHISSLAKFQYIVINSGFELMFNPKFSMSLAYQWNYLSYKQDNPYYEINHQIQANAVIKIK